jgi:hypothetical protein
MLRNLNQSSGGRRILGVPQVGILAATIASQTATGDNGAGLLYDEAINPANTGKQLRLVVTSPPSAGVFFAYENGSFDFSGAPDGSYSIGYNVLADNVLFGSDTATVAVGAVSATAPGVTLTGTASIFAGSASGGTPVEPPIPEPSASKILRNLQRVASGRRILGTCYVGLPAAQIVTETETGTYGKGLLYAPSLLNPGKQLRVGNPSLVPEGNLFVEESGAFDLTGSSAGYYEIHYQYFVDNILAGTLSVFATHGSFLWGKRPALKADGRWTAAAKF